MKNTPLWPAAVCNLYLPRGQRTLSPEDQTAAATVRSGRPLKDKPKQSGIMSKYEYVQIGTVSLRRRKRHKRGYFDDDDDEDDQGD